MLSSSSGLDERHGLDAVVLALDCFQKTRSYGDKNGNECSITFLHLRKERKEKEMKTTDSQKHMFGHYN